MGGWGVEKEEKLCNIDWQLKTKVQCSPVSHFLKEWNNLISSIFLGDIIKPHTFLHDDTQSMKFSSFTEALLYVHINEMPQQSFIQNTSLMYIYECIHIKSQKWFWFDLNLYVCSCVCLCSR